MRCESQFRTRQRHQGPRHCGQRVTPTTFHRTGHDVLERLGMENRVDNQVLVPQAERAQLGAGPFGFSERRAFRTGDEDERRSLRIRQDSHCVLVLLLLRL